MARPSRAWTPIDRLIEPSIKKLDENPPYYKSQVVAEVLRHRDLQGMLADLNQRYRGWNLGEIVRRQIEARVTEQLQKRDANAIRTHECYAAGGPERRWMPLRSMTRETLRAVMRETRTQERHLHLKGEGYQFFLDELERLGGTATVGDVYDRVLPHILRQRARAG